MITAEKQRSASSSGETGCLTCIYGSRCDGIEHLADVACLSNLPRFRGEKYRLAPLRADDDVKNHRCFNNRAVEKRVVSSAVVSSCSKILTLFWAHSGYEGTESRKT